MNQNAEGGPYSTYLASSQRRERVVSLSRQARFKFWIELFRGVMQKPPIREILPVFVAKAIYSFACLGVPFARGEIQKRFIDSPVLTSNESGTLNLQATPLSLGRWRSH